MEGPPICLVPEEPPSQSVNNCNPQSCKAIAESKGYCLNGDVERALSVLEAWNFKLRRLVSGVKGLGRFGDYGLGAVCRVCGV